MNLCFNPKTKTKTKTERYADSKKKEEILLKNIKKYEERYGGIGFASDEK